MTNDIDKLLTKDLKHIWHPCAQMKDYETFKPVITKKAQGCYIELHDGKQIIDAIASWWCKSLGHNHPRLKNALIQQTEKFEHILLANTTNETIVKLSQMLSKLIPGMNKAFYASDGSCAVEIAMKMSVHSRVIDSEHKRNKFISLSNSYHGETLGTLSVSDVGIFREPYQNLLFDTHFIQNIPYVLDITDPLWKDCSSVWPKIEKSLNDHIEFATAVIVEPIVQGAGGMKIYSMDFLRRLRHWTESHNIHLIADEIMTGIGRTGKMLACNYANISPDFLCLAKGLTSGWMPFSAVLTNDEIYSKFYDDYKSGKAFLHSHTFSGHVLAAAIAVEVLNIFEEEQICDQSLNLGSIMLNGMHEIAANTGKLKNVRGIGAIVAADLITDNPQQRLGYEIYQKAMTLGAILKPLGNTIYWLPPLNMDLATFEQLKKITQEAITY
jgi:adenosylmethionine-8-amino-7-oxononanoate aminotransferase